MYANSNKRSIYLIYRLHGENASQYESGATKLYLHGRTETIRSTSVESAAFCKAFLSDGVSVSNK